MTWYEIFFARKKSNSFTGDPSRQTGSTPEGKSETLTAPTAPAGEPAGAGSSPPARWSEDPSKPTSCPTCGSGAAIIVRIPNGYRCAQCGTQMEFEQVITYAGRRDGRAALIGRSSSGEPVDQQDGFSLDPPAPARMRDFPPMLRRLRR